jgi:hypothetical protein
VSFLADVSKAYLKQYDPKFSENTTFNRLAALEQSIFGATSTTEVVPIPSA